MPTARNRRQAAPGTATAFTRFVLCGGGVGVAAGFAVTALGAWIPWVLANALVTVVSTVLSTELHARFTFGTGGRATRRQHAQSAGSAAAAYVVTCLAMFVLEHLAAAPDAMLRQTVYLAAAALAGVGRFAVLRLLVFARHRSRAATPAPTPLRRPLRAVTATASAPVDRAALRRAA
ncbi:GtrA family protein [Streptomyces sp. NPDC085479]|uniref:GtrA family protein n=1 Tax=Streptomyces sp. NPDC085479 TaxID=3365726 RepID=UPI0037D67473